MSLYYETPPQEIFDDIKAVAIKIWKTYDDQFGYATEKIDRVNSIQNFKDNYAAIIGMFDNYNQGFLNKLISKKTREYFDRLHKEGIFGFHPHGDSWLKDDVPKDDPRWKLLDEVRSSS